MKYTIIQYCFTTPDEEQVIINLHLDAETLTLQNFAPQKLPAWTKLDYHQCSNCPLDPASSPHCPVAINLTTIVERFHGFTPHDEIHLDVITEERAISQDTSMESAISSLMGLVMATSGCPHTAFFKPMARFHLALASEEETVYRATSMFLLAQYFLQRDRKNGAISLKGLSKIYHNIHIINTSIVERLRAASERDPSLNAIVLLDMYALFLPHVIDKSLEEVRYLFESFLTDQYNLLDTD